MRTEDERELAALENAAALRLSAAPVRDDALGRVRERVRDRASGAGATAVVRFPGRYARVLALAAAAVIAAVVGAGALWPESFATASARQTLFPDQGVVHFTIAVTSAWATGAPNASASPRDISIVNEYWLAQGGLNARNTERNAAGAVLREVISRGADGRIRQAVVDVPASGGATMTPQSTTGPRFAWLQDGPIAISGRPLLGDLDWWIHLRATLSTGTAEVLGRQQIGDDTCWHIRSVDTTFTPASAQQWLSADSAVESTAPFPAYRRTIDAYLRVGDYAPVKATVRLDVDFGPEAEIQPGFARVQTLVNAYRITGWEVVPTSTLAPDFFEMSSLPTTEAAVSHIVYGTRDIGTFTGFPVWGLSEKSALARSRHLSLGGAYDFDYTLGDLATGLADPSQAAWAANPVTPETYDLENAIPDGPPVANERVTSYYVSDYDAVHAWVVVTSMPPLSPADQAAYLRDFANKGTPVEGTFHGMPYRGYQKSGPPYATGTARYGRIIATGPAGSVMVAFGGDAGQIPGIGPVLADLVRMDGIAR